MNITLDSPLLLLAIPLIWALVIVEFSGGFAEMLKGPLSDRVLLGVIGILLVPCVWLMFLRLVQIATTTGLV